MKRTGSQPVLNRLRIACRVLLAVSIGLITLFPFPASAGRPALAAAGLCGEVSSKKGIQFGAPFAPDGSLLLNEHAADLLRDTGAGWVRLNIIDRWTTGPQELYSRYQPVVESLRKRGLNVVGLLNNEFLWAPRDEWQQNAEADGNNPYIESFSAKAGEFAALFSGQITCWQIWNEPDYTFTRIEPANFAQLLRQTADQIKARNPQAKIISSGVATDDAAQYLTQTYLKGEALGLWRRGDSPIDGIGLHLYTVQPSQIRSYLAAFLAVRNTYDNPAKKFFITEIGWPSRPHRDGAGQDVGLTETQQADLLAQKYEAVASLPQVELAFWFFLIDHGIPKLGQPQAEPGFFGLLRADDSRKPAWCVFANQPRENCPAREVSAVSLTGQATGHSNVLNVQYPFTRQTWLAIERAVAAILPAGTQGLKALGPSSPWVEIATVDVSRQTKYIYADRAIEPNTAYCYRLRAYTFEAVSGYLNEICLALLPPSEYPYGIRTVQTIPEAVAPLKDLRSLFDTLANDSAFALIHSIAEPVSVAVEFEAPATLVGFSSSLGSGEAALDEYLWKVEIDRDGSGKFRKLLDNVKTQGGVVQIEFPRPQQASAFRLTVKRSTGDGIVRMSELTPLFAPPPTAGAISGIVVDGTGSPETALKGAYVQVCRVGGRCRLALSADDGTYTVNDLEPGDYVLTGFPPAGSALLRRTTGPITLANGATLRDQIVALGSPLLPPAGTSLNGRPAPNGLPLVHWAETAKLTTQGCAGGSAGYTLSQDRVVKRAGTLTESSSPGLFNATVAPLAPVQGLAKLEITTLCPDASISRGTFDIAILAGGSVKTVEGKPIPDATVTLYRAEIPNGPFEVVSDSSAVVSPVNPHNPDTTDSAGRFGWDAITGYYKVRVSKEGCTSVENPAQSVVESKAFPGFGLVMDVDLRLSCGSKFTPTPSPTVTAMPSRTGASSATPSPTSTPVQTRYPASPTYTASPPPPTGTQSTTGSSTATPSRTPTTLAPTNASKASDD